MKLHHQISLLQVILCGLSRHVIHAKKDNLRNIPEDVNESTAASTATSSSSSRSLQQATCIYQADFDQGTLIIDEPGDYKLCEDITFYPQVNAPEAVGAAAEAFEPDNNEYDVNAFGLGFFAALCIATSDVTLDLNGYTIEQSPEHALLQRFFAVIELADSPFIEDVGPAQFVGEMNTFNAASNIRIVGPGTIGRSAHHGIHGNENSNVVIDRVTFKDFEVAAVSLNNVDGLTISNCDIPKNRHDVPVLGMFSAARFIRPFGKVLKDLGFTMTLRGVETSAAQVYDALVDSINTVYDDIVANGRIDPIHEAEYELFDNPNRVVDGPCYAFLVNGRGPAVGDFAFDLPAYDNETSSDIVIRRNHIKGIKCWTNEVPAIVENGKVVNDARGAVFQLVRSSDNAPIAINEDGTYKGNVVADMQIMVAKAIIDNDLMNTPSLQTLVNTINSTIIDWASSGTDIYEPEYRCNGDSMHHVSKGMAIIRVDKVEGFTISMNSIKQVHNLSPPPFDNCFDYHTGANVENAEDESSIQQGPNIRGISIAAGTGVRNRRSRIFDNTIANFNSIEADVIVGIDIQGMSDQINISRNHVNLKNGYGEDDTDQFIALRLRDYADVPDSDILVKKDNTFVQEVQMMTTEITPVTGCGASNRPKSEWEFGETPGGCPFGYKPKKNKSIFQS